MRKLLLTLLFALGIPIMFNYIGYNNAFAEQTIIQYDDNIGHCRPTEPPGPIVTAKEFFGGWMIVFAIFFIIFIILSPFIIFGILYEIVPNDSYIKHLMDIAIAIFGVLTLGLIYIDKRSK